MNKIKRLFIKIRKNARGKQQGIAMIIVLIALALATMLGLAVASATTVEVQIANASESSTKTFYYAEAGLNMVLAMAKNMNGNFNDLLAGPPGASTDITQRLRNHGNELVKGTNGWEITPTMPLPSSGLNIAMFPTNVKAFTAVTNNNPVKDGGDDKPNLSDLTVPSGPLTSFPGLISIANNSTNWAGKLEFNDTVAGNKYIVLVEVYDDDDPFARLFDAYPSKYPFGYPSGAAIAPIYKAPGQDPSNPASYNAYDNCTRDFVECPGEDTAVSDTKYGSFSGQNKDRNARVLVRSTARQIVSIGGTPTVIAETILDSVIGFFPYPAVITNSCITVGGSSSILGAYGGVHTNLSLCLDGTDFSIDLTATSSSAVCDGCPSSTPTVEPCPPAGTTGYLCGFSGPLQPLLPIPDLNPLVLASDPAPPLPQTADGRYWITDVIDLSNLAIDERLSANSIYRGSDIIYVSEIGASGSKRSRILGILGISSAHLTALENAVGDFDDDDALIIDRTGLGIARTYRIASMDNQTTANWYQLAVDQPLVIGVNPIPTTALIPAAPTKCGFSENNPPNNASCNGPTPCNAGGADCTSVQSSGSRHDNGGLWKEDTGGSINSLTGKILFFDGSLDLNGGGVGSPGNPFKTTFITTGFFKMRGNPDLTGKLQADLAPIAPPFSQPKFQVIAGTDVDLSGDSGTLKFDGICYAREQVRLTGNALYSGQLVAGDFTRQDYQVCYSELDGSSTVVFNGNNSALGAIKSAAWRILKF